MSTPLDFKLSKNFAWGELTRTGQSALQDQNREEAEAYKPALTALAVTLLQPVRDRWGALRINSGFRGRSVNQKVNGAKASQHLIGEAVDFMPLSEGVTLEQVFDWIRKESGLPFGQVINEQPSPASRWIHLSLGEPWRKGPCREALFFDGKKYHPVK
jgi:uncharacterized protein YcbK (DUF882 family)